MNKRLWLGRYLLLFPYEVKGRTFRTTLCFKFLSFLVAVFLAGCCVWLMIMNGKDDETFSFLFWGPLFTSFITLPFNQILIHTKKATLNDFLSNLQKSRPYFKVDDKKDTIKSCLPIVFIFLIYFGFWFITIKDHDMGMLSLTFLYSQLGSFLCIAMVEQFCLLLSLVGRQLSRTNLLSDLDQDALIAAAANLNEVFSLHLLVTMMVIFVSQLGKIYSTITVQDHIHLYDTIIVIMQSFPIWRVVSSCQEFAKEVTV